MTGTSRLGLSRLLRHVGTAAGGARVAATVGAVVVGWVVVYAVLGFPEWMATTLEVVAAATTLVMVFVIHHSQRRTEVATQLKLDELVRSSDADDDFMQLEVATDHELERQRHEPSRATRM